MIRRTVIAVVFGAGMLLWIGCATPEQRYQTLSFFFDGVPNPNPTTHETAGAGIANPGAAKPVVLLSMHKPYVDKECQSCHDSPTPGPSSAVLSTDSCIKCHDKVPNQHPVMHEAVVNRSCLWCHEPHGSKFPNLLRTDNNALCTQCHQTALLSTQTPEHASEQTACMSCHAAHGASDRALLKPRRQ
jgi:predicted CXXCH cytochrome family protein